MVNYNRFVVPTKPNSNDKLSVIIIGSNYIKGLSSKPALPTVLMNEKETILEYQIRSILSIFPDSDIFVIAGYDYKRILSKQFKNVRIIENESYETYGEIEDIRLAINCILTDNLLIISNNTLFNSDTLRQIKSNNSSVLIGNKVEYKDSLGLIHFNSQSTNIAFGVGHKFYKMLMLRKSDLELFKKFINNKTNRNLFLFEAINDLINKNCLIRAVENNQYIKEILCKEDVPCI